MFYIDPVACPRPRFNRKTGGVYYPKTYKEFRKEFITLLEKNNYPKMEEGNENKPIMLYAVFAFHADHNGFYTGKEDLDNLLKSLCDVLQDYGAILDDKQIVSIMASKENTKEPSHIAFKLQEHISIFY